MPFLNLDLDYFEHPKTTQLVGLLGRGSEVYPLRLWVYVGKFHSSDGHLNGYTDAAIEQILRCPDSHGETVAALEKVGFIERTEKGFKVHDWKAHQGHIHALKMRNKKVARNRWNKIKKQYSTVDTNGIPKNTTSIPQSYPIHTIPNHTKPNTKESARKVFIKPTPLEVTQYATEIGFQLDGVKFVDYYESKGWVVGKSPMKSWQACVRTWKANGYGNGNGSKQTPSMRKIDDLAAIP